MIRKLFPLVLAFHFSFPASSQSLQTGFNGREYLDMLAISFQYFDTARVNAKIPAPKNYTTVYRPAETGLKNCWNMWYRNDNKVAVIAIRGTVNAAASWMENFYAAMTPATGSIQINDSTVFKYRLSADERASVHVGWLIGLAHMAPDMVKHIKAAYKKGIREFIITGHSQGGALAFLTTSYLYYLVRDNELPKDILFKTYSSAAPKPGNTVYVYDYDFITRNGRGFNVVNAADWVPETAFSVQTLADFNTPNPFENIDGSLQKQPWLVKLYLKSKYNKLKNGTRKAQKRFEKTLGNTAYKQVKKLLPQLRQPVYAHNNNYQRAGVPVILMPDSDYYTIFPSDPKKLFQHHAYAAYYMLAKQYYGE
jgi:hypothetical protein